MQWSDQRNFFFFFFFCNIIKLWHPKMYFSVMKAGKYTFVHFRFWWMSFGSYWHLLRTSILSAWSHKIWLFTKEVLNQSWWKSQRLAHSVKVRPMSLQTSNLLIYVFSSFVKNCSAWWQFNHTHNIIYPSILANRCTTITTFV